MYMIDIMIIVPIFSVFIAYKSLLHTVSFVPCSLKIFLSLERKLTFKKVSVLPIVTVSGSEIKSQTADPILLTKPRCLAPPRCSIPS